MAPPFFSFLCSQRSERKIINIPWRAGALFLRDCQTGTYIYGRGREEEFHFGSKSKRARIKPAVRWDFEANCPPLVFFSRVESSSWIRRQIWETRDRVSLCVSYCSLRVHSTDTLFNISHLVAQRRPLSGAQQRNKNKEDGVWERVAINESRCDDYYTLAQRTIFAHKTSPPHPCTTQREAKSSAACSKFGGWLNILIEILWKNWICRML